MNRAPSPHPDRSRTLRAIGALLVSRSLARRTVAGCIGKPLRQPPKAATGEHWPAV
jgi:hypothetical protein